MEKNRIDKDSKVPLHYQIYSDLLEKIENGTYQVNDKIPAESELQKFYGVSRITVRGAIQELEQKGRVKKFRGIGTIVCEPKQKFNLQHLSSFSADTSEHGGRPNSVLLNFAFLRPEPKIAEALHLTKEEKVYYIERNRLRGDTIIGLNKAYIKPVNNLVLTAADFTAEASLYAILGNSGINLRQATELLEARMPSKELCKILQINKNQPIFYKERTTYNNQNDAVEYVEIFYRADIYQYKVTMDLDR